MPELDDDRPKFTRTLPATLHARVIEPAPTAAGDDLWVTVDGYDGGLHRWGPCLGWEAAAGGALPAAGDAVLLVLADDDGADVPWAAAWHPS